MLLLPLIWMYLLDILPFPQSYDLINQIKLFEKLHKGRTIKWVWRSWAFGPPLPSIGTPALLNCVQFPPENGEDAYNPLVVTSKYEAVLFHDIVLVMQLKIWMQNIILCVIPSVSPTNLASLHLPFHLLAQ